MRGEVLKQKKKFFLSELVNFSVSDRLARNFSTVRNCQEKKEKPLLIKLTKIKMKKGN